MKTQEAYLDSLDISYSYRLAKKMEEIRSNPALGYRTAGSEAELLTGRMLEEEMKRIGLPCVYRDEIQTDAWEFTKAQLSYEEEDGTKRTALLGAYQTDFVTGGPKRFELVFAGKGTLQDYEGLDVTGRLVLVEMNQRDEWWINYPVYQAHLKGAAAVIAVQTGGYGEVDDRALNAQDIAGPACAPAFSISRKDARPLRRMLAGGKEVTVTLDADSRVQKDRTTYNIVGEIPGRHPGRRILLSAHYDSYFDGFQDDNTAVSMMLSIAAALRKIGYEPENTLTFCAMAAEEWGVSDSPCDWSTGAYEQVFTAHPEWRGTVIADLNFELPALAHGTRARIRSTWEYVRFLEGFLEELPELTAAYPEEPRVTAPIETWSDDFSIAISGIPSMVNDFTGGSFMETNYHSQFDNHDFYDEDVYRMHHELFGLLLLALDATAVAPLDFSGVFGKIRERLDVGRCEKAGADGDGFLKALSEAIKTARSLYDEVEAGNREYRRLKDSREKEAANDLYRRGQKAEQALLKAFGMEQDAFVRIDWYGNVLFPHQVLQERLRLLEGALEDLEKGGLLEALGKLYRLDNNCYAFSFEEEVYRHFTEYAFRQPKERLKWGYGRILGHESLFETVKSLLDKKEAKETDFSEEIRFLKEAVSRQERLYVEEIASMKETVIKMESMLREATGSFYGK